MSSARKARVLKVDSAPAAKPDAGSELVVCDAAKAASDCEPLPKYEEIRFHTCDMRQPRLRRKILYLRRKRSYGSCVLARVLLPARGNCENKRESRSDLFGKAGLTG
jgi:hypothetical protein